MANQGLTIAQAARTTGLSTRTIRRYIKSGRISAQVIPGKHGKEFRIANIPEELTRQRTIEKQPTLTKRIRTLENQVKLLTAAKQPWWKRLFKRRA